MCCALRTETLIANNIAASARVARSARALKVGTLRPAVVLYDEPHPLGDDIGTIQTADMARKPDMLIIMGTSLKVHGFKKLVKDFARVVHESAPSTFASSGSPLKKNAKSFAGKVVFVNMTAPGSEWDGIIDYHVAGETDRWCEKVIEDWKKARPSDWEVQKTLVATGEAATTGTFHVAKEITNTLAAKAKGVWPFAHDMIGCVLTLCCGNRRKAEAQPQARERAFSGRRDLRHYPSSSRSATFSRQTSSEPLPLQRRRIESVEEVP